MPTIRQINSEVRAATIEKGWRAADGGPALDGGTRPRSWREYRALLHTEAAEITENYRTRGMASYTTATGKPDDVAAEMADVLIRLIDMADAHGIDLAQSTAFELSDDRTGPAIDKAAETWTIADVLYRPQVPNDVRSLADAVDWLHGVIANVKADAPESLVYTLCVLVTVARMHGIDLDAEYERKAAYNLTRSYRHGGRTL